MQSQGHELSLMADGLPLWPRSGARLHPLQRRAQLNDELLIHLGGAELRAHQVLDQGVEAQLEPLEASSSHQSLQTHCLKLMHLQGFSDWRRSVRVDVYHPPSTTFDEHL